MQQSVKIELPKASSTASTSKPDSIQVSVDQHGKIFWNTSEVSLTEFSKKAKIAADLNPMPDVNLRADKRVAYEYVAQVLTASKRNGLTKIGFVTESP
jgi:biopolymer transport protein ExbD